MKRILLITLLFLDSIAGFSQVQTTVIELPDANVRINTNGVLFQNLETEEGAYEAPAEFQ